MQIEESDEATLPRTETRIGPAVVLLAIGVGAIESCKYFLPALLRPDLFTGDACQHVWWTYRYANPSLFPGDVIATFYSQPSFAPLGWRGLYRLFVPFVDAQVFSEMIPFVLGALVMALACAIGRRCAGGRVAGAVIAILITAYAGLFYLVEGGVARSFALPVLMLGMWALLARRVVWAGAAMLLGALFYPPITISLGFCIAVVLGIRLIRERKLPRGWLVALVLSVAAVAVCARNYLRPLPEGFGPIRSGIEARAMAEFNPGGRSQFFHPDWRRYWFSGDRSGIHVSFQMFVLMTVFVVGSIVLWRSRAVSLEAWALLGTSAVLFLLAHATLFKLYLPSRYTMYSLPVFGVMWASSVFPRVQRIYPLSLRERVRVRGNSEAETTRHRESSSSDTSLTLPSPGGRGERGELSLAIVTILVVGAFAWQHVRKSVPPLNRLDHPAGIEAAYGYLRARTDVAAVVMAHPFDANAIPLRARRSVVASEETSLPYHVGYYSRVRERVAGELEMCWASSWNDVDAIADRYGATIVLVNRGRYADKSSILYFAPFDADSRREFARGKAAGFVLLDPPAERLLFTSGDVTLIRIGSKREGH